jgi:hypothetical protein
MRLILTAIALAAMLVWPVGLRAADRGAQAAQAGGNGQASSTESIDSAKSYIDRAWKLGFPSAGAGTPYVLKAEFTARGSSGEVETGTYTDTWLSDKQWRREADFGKSRFVRSRNGKKRYRLDEGPDAALLQFVLTAMEPLPFADWLHEGDWRVEREQADGVPLVRVATGHENPDGTPDPKDFIGFWFDGNGQLVKTYSNKLETRRLKFSAFNGIQVARVVEVLTGGTVGMRIDVTQLAPAGSVDSHMFTIKHHDWDGPYTPEVR